VHPLPFGLPAPVRKCCPIPVSRKSQAMKFTARWPARRQRAHRQGPVSEPPSPIGEGSNGHDYCDERTTARNRDGERRHQNVDGVFPRRTTVAGAKEGASKNKAHRDREGAGKGFERIWFLPDCSKVSLSLSFFLLLCGHILESRLGGGVLACSWLQCTPARRRRKTVSLVWRCMMGPKKQHLAAPRS